MVFGEDGSRVRTGDGPRVMVTLYSTVIGLVRLAGHVKIKRTLSAHGRGGHQEGQFAWSPPLTNDFDGALQITRGMNYLG